MSTTALFRHPLETRYASEAMRRLLAEDYRFLTWRDIWIAIARLERELGVSVVSEEQITAMQAARERINYDRVAELERESRHDVMAHAEAFGQECSIAKGIIHLGCTSCTVTDNADLIIMREALGLLGVGLARVIARFGRFAYQWRHLPTLGYTHFQPAQLTTVGKRACLWIQDLLFDLEHYIYHSGYGPTNETMGKYIRALFDVDSTHPEGLAKETELSFKPVVRFQTQFQAE